MIKSINKNITMAILLCLTLMACGSDTKEPEKKIGYGEMSDGLYLNDYFNMSIKVPEGWAIQSQAEQERLMEIGGNLVSGDDENMKAAMKESIKDSVNLFSFFRYEQGAPVDFNSSIISVAERVAHMPGITKGADYHFHVKNLLQSGQIKYEFPNEMYTEELSGKSFDIMPMQVSINGLTVYQDYYAARVNDYALVLILSYSSDAEKEELLEVLNTVKFDK